MIFLIMIPNILLLAWCFLAEYRFRKLEKEVWILKFERGER